MGAFIVATLTVTDPAKFGAYREAITGLAEQFGGRYLLRGAVVAMLEGETPAGERVVVLEFPDEASARAFYNSETYQAAKALRAGGGTVTMRLVGG